MNLLMTHHAVGRSRQRGYSQEAVDVLLKFGRYRHNGRGVVVVAMDAASRAEARRRLGRRYERVARRLDFLAIVADGAVLTLVPRTGRLKFDGLPYKRSYRRKERTFVTGRWS